ncbi:MAG: TIGR01212 family radical SAM protein [Acidiferrobacteraceae bacterium]
MTLSEYVHTFGTWMRTRHGERVHKVAIEAGFTCPNRDGTVGSGGCTFCNNRSFGPSARSPHAAPEKTVEQQIAAGRAVIARRTGARLLLAYFQTYTNTYASIERLQNLYDQALSVPGVIGLAIGTRPDCVPDAVLALLAQYQDNGHDVWLELGVQSSFDTTLAAVNRGHGFGAYQDAVRRARCMGLSVCAHLIIGLPGETAVHARVTLERVLNLGVDGLKLHPLHVVRKTRLAHAWRRGEYFPIEREEYLETVATLVALTPAQVVFHRLTGTATPDILLAPAWCAGKWSVLNGIEATLKRLGLRQGGAQYPSWMVACDKA